MPVKAINVYVALIVAAALATLPLVPWDSLWSLWEEGLWGFVAFTLFGILAESLTLRFTVAKGGGQTSIAFLPLWASIVLFGPAPTILFMFIIGVVGEIAIRKKPLLRALFNIGQWTFSVSVGSLAYAALGGVALAYETGSGLPTLDRLVDQFLPFLAFGAIFMVLNLTSVSMAISLTQGERFRKIAKVVLGQSGANLLYYLLLTPLAIALAYLYLEADVFGVALFLLPMLAIRHAYQINHQLQQANRDLLKALVKAIETRDPYTSGHSLRVSALALKICDAMGVSGRRSDMVETAALLHDIGKIDAIYTEILRKPDQLSDSERAIIESHVVRGVDLLESVSSFPREVLDAVRFHHERMDGKGYPDGLSGDHIPLGARIIKVCDAIDAMLSDRPYRKALSIPTVEEELRIHSGTQFDGEIVKAILASDLLERHEEELRVQRQMVGLTPPDGPTENRLTDQPETRSPSDSGARWSA
jgi:putative nucleotidyltransferase with HDIG domain